MTKREIICEMGHEESVVLDSPDFDEAIIGVTGDGNVVYNYDAMVKCLEERDNMSEQEAAEFIDYNTVRAIPYMPDPKPIIMYPLWE